MYKKKNMLDNFNNKTTEYIFKFNEDDSVTSFANIETNDTFEYKQYLKWVAEGNEAEEWVNE
jgi:lysine/ornithine N-monooxygenase